MIAVQLHQNIAVKSKRQVLYSRSQKIHLNIPKPKSVLVQMKSFKLKMMMDISFYLEAQSRRGDDLFSTKNLVAQLAWGFCLHCPLLLQPPLISATNSHKVSLPQWLLCFGHVQSGCCWAQRKHVWRLPGNADQMSEWKICMDWPNLQPHRRNFRSCASGNTESISTGLPWNIACLPASKNVSGDAIEL